MDEQAIADAADKWLWHSKEEALVRQLITSAVSHERSRVEAIIQSELPRTEADALIAVISHVDG